MKRPISISICVVILIVSFWGWQFYHAKNSLIHKPIEIDHVRSVSLWVAEKEEYNPPMGIDREQYAYLVELFNKYNPTGISEEKIPLPRAQIIFNLDKGTVIVSYGKGTLYISRNDIHQDVSKYILTDAPELKVYFENLLK